MESEAFFLCKVGSPQEAFELRSLELNAPVANEVMVKTEAFGLNYADVMAVKGLYRGAPPFPCVIGYEVIGEIVAVGPDSNPSLMGKRVLAFCRFGGYAKHVITLDYAVIPVEDQPAVDLLALCTQGVTAYYMASYLAPVHPGDRVLVHAAAGGVGSLLVQLSKLQGASVVAKVGGEEKKKWVKSIGADHVINYREEDYQQALMSWLGEDSLDVSFNPVGGSTYKKDMSLLGADGRMMLFGGSELGSGKWGFFSKFNFVRKMGLMMPIVLMMQSRSVLGVNMLSIADTKPEVMRYCLEQVFNLYRDGKLKIKSGGMFDADQLAEAHDLLAGGNTMGKLGITWE